MYSWTWNLFNLTLYTQTLFHTKSYNKKITSSQKSMKFEINSTKFLKHLVSKNIVPTYLPFPLIIFTLFPTLIPTSTFNRKWQCNWELSTSLIYLVFPYQSVLYRLKKKKKKNFIIQLSEKTYTNIIILFSEKKYVF